MMTRDPDLGLSQAGFAACTANAFQHQFRFPDIQAEQPATSGWRSHRTSDAPAD
jgi:hypothetical protein